MKFISLLIVFCFLSCGNKLSSVDSEEQNGYNKVQIAISEWIKKYALYPESYEAISFSDYSESYSSRDGEKISDTENYVIKHVHKIKDKNGDSTTFSGYFILEHDFFVSMIEITRSKAIGGAFPPKTNVWTNKFGRELTKQDSIEFTIRQKHASNKLINDLKGGLNNGDITSEDDTDINKLKNLLDTLSTE